MHLHQLHQLQKLLSNTKLLKEQKDNFVPLF